MKRNARYNYSNNATLVLSKSFDDGEILSQKNSAISREEYVVQSSITDLAFEEYVVAGAANTNATTALQQSIDVNLFYTPLQTYVTAPEVNLEVLNSSNDRDKLSVLDNIAEQNNGSTNYPPSSKQSSFEYLEPMEKVSISHAASEDNFEKDIEAILGGKKVFNPDKKVVESASMASSMQPNTQQNRQAPIVQKENEHAIFDQIAQSMEYAKAYDLGSIDLEKRFSDFDKIMDIQKSVPAQNPLTSTAKSIVDSEDFIKDLDAIARAASVNTTPAAKVPTAPPVVDAIGSKQTVTAAPAESPVAATSAPTFPARPTNIRPLTSSERAQLYGTFPYEPDPSTFSGDGIRVTNDWRTQNIVAVAIPQLNGKLMDAHPITNGTIQFHRAGAIALQNLWSAWQAAGLLDRILTFQGGYASRYIRHSQSRSPRPLSNHAWGTAFDINAAWNGFGAQPALVGQQGCVRELVAIANANGFFWGGHFRGSADGMHFELGKTIS